MTCDPVLQNANEHTMKSAYRTYNTHISETLLNTSPRKTCLTLQITSLLTACSHQRGSQSPLHTYINIRICSLSLCIHTCWRHLQGSCCLLDPAVSLLEQMERNAGGGEQARTSELCEERLDAEVSLFFIFSTHLF